MASSDEIPKHEQLDQSNYETHETFSIPLEPSSIYCGMAYLPLPLNELALIYTHNDKNILELRQTENNNFDIIRSVELNDISFPVDDFVWCSQRNEFLLMSNGRLITYNLEKEQITNTLLVDKDKNKCRIACNSTLIACVDSRTLKLYELNTLKFLRQKRLDHVCEDIEFDDQHFISTHTGKLEVLDRTLFSIRRFAIGGTSICRFNTKLWLIADSFDDRLLWQSLDKLLLTVSHMHQPKSIAVIPTISRIVIQSNGPNRLLIYDPINIDSCK
ncbi:unnamed protein product [Rotaria socialis]|uniref:Uncharacterized protein n=3 Tax=Rotaria socialis TaxID=392032 RepID=A0A817N5H0_9BILA|nr:unnamed protein product [Rotaria socialis]CAF3440662.1 unnamed protein product [Rotaria socialis]CAF3644795.1 unnamed protein product [Rotaria socialis]CAF3692769.1 unnamed protein product [Rotaria socialis]CAF3713001.1 unnamed protein product [Rotaria socialis]